MKKQRFDLKRFAIPQSGHFRERPGNIHPDCDVLNVVFKVVSPSNFVLRQCSK